MPYLNADGSIVQKRSPWRLSIISDFFWGIVDFIFVFFATLFDPESAHHSLRPKQGPKRGSGRGGGGGPPGSGGGPRPKPRIRGIGDMPSSSMRASAAG